MFLYKKENALSSELCNSFINTFENSPDIQYPGVLLTPEGYKSDSGKTSTDICFYPSMLNDKIWGSLLKDFINILEKSMLDYYDRYKIGLENVQPFQIDKNFNLQRYLPSEGFSVYHCERAGETHSNRILVWMIYLNDVTDRGETEFYYQHHFEVPKQGNLIIWPADWTYTHRGIPSPSQTKYILTGWFSHISLE